MLQYRRNAHKRYGIYNKPSLLQRLLRLLRGFSLS